jgi:replicative DNA helicase
MLLLAPPNAGKSWFLVNVGKHNVIGGRRNVLHVTLENSLDMTLQRYTQSFLALTQYETETLDLGMFRRYKDPTRDDDDRDSAQWEPHVGPREYEAIRELDRKNLQRRLKPYQMRGKLLVKHYPTSTLTLGMLNAYLDMLEQTENFRPDILLLDYLTLMHLDTARNELRISIGQLGRQLRGLAEIRDCAVVTVLQVNREGAGRRVITGQHTGEDWSLVGTADVFLTYNQTAHERKLHIARLFIDKTRSGSRAKWWAAITQAYEIGQFCLDSVYMSRGVEDQFTESDE